MTLLKGLQLFLKMVYMSRTGTDACDRQEKSKGLDFYYSLEFTCVKSTEAR